MKDSRLFRILYYLLSRGHATAVELAKEFEVSVRTIYRDIDALSGAGIPVYTEPGRNGGIHLLEEYVLDKTLFSDSEKREILATLQSLAAVDHAYEKELLTKLSALFHVPPEEWFEVDFSRWGRKTRDNERFEMLKQGVISHRMISITYVNSNGEQSERIIHPLKLMYKSREWYVKAFCTDKQDFRLFKLNRIIRAALLEREFVPVGFPDSLDTLPGKYNRIKLRFPKEMAYRVYDEFEAEEIEVQEDGALVAASEMPEDSWLIGYLLSFGTQVEVLEPAYLRGILAEQAKKIYEMNKP